MMRRAFRHVVAPMCAAALVAAVALNAPGIAAAAAARLWPPAAPAVVAAAVALPAAAVPVPAAAVPAASAPAPPRPAAAGPIPPAAHRLRGELLRAAHGQWGLDAPVALLAAQVHQESAWNAAAMSRVGAAGLAQFMPATAAWWCARTGTPAAQCSPTTPAWALRAMVGYDRWLHGQLAAAGPDPARWWATLRAYNGGLGHWQAEARAAGTTDRAAVDAACGRARRHVTHCAENLGYPQRIMVHLQPRYAGWGLTVQPPGGNAAGVLR